MKTSENIAELAKALALAQSQIKPAIKDSENPFFKSNYADLESVWGACREALTANGLSVVQGSDPFLHESTKVRIITRIIHTSGQWIESALEATPVKNDPQAIGSCVSYLRRYSLAAMVGVVQTDDDANAATQPKGKVKLDETKPIGKSNLSNAATKPSNKSGDGNNHASQSGSAANQTTGPSEAQIKAFIDKNWKSQMYNKEVHEKVCKALDMLQAQTRIMYKPKPTLAEGAQTNG